MVLLRYIDRFGAQAVLGRTLGAGEMRRMAAAERIVNAYQSRKKADSWAEWAEMFPELNAILEDAILAGNDG